MNDVRLDPQQIPARAELLLAAELGEDAPGRPIYAEPEPDGHDDGEPTARTKVGSILTRRLSAAEATETLSGAAYGNPLRGRPERSPSVPIGSAVLASEIPSFTMQTGGECRRSRKLAVVCIHMGSDRSHRSGFRGTTS